MNDDEGGRRSQRSVVRGAILMLMMTNWPSDLPQPTLLGSCCCTMVTELARLKVLELAEICSVFAPFDVIGINYTDSLIRIRLSVCTKGLDFKGNT